MLTCTIGAILRELCRWKGVNILEAEVCIDHIHMLLEIPPKMSVSGFMGCLFADMEVYKGQGSDTEFRKLIILILSII